MNRCVSILLPVGIVSFAVLACSLSSLNGGAGTTEAISTRVAETVQKIQTDAKLPSLQKLQVTLNRITLPRIGTKAPDQQTGFISGIIHHAGIPDAMRIYWREIHSGKVGFIEVIKTDTVYKISGLIPGDYNIISWYWPQGASGAVTTTNIISANGAAQQQTCKASLRKIHLDAGQNYIGADIGCWGGDFFFLVTPVAP
jgi:hypothetical protein